MSEFLPSRSPLIRPRRRYALARDNASRLTSISYKDPASTCNLTYDFNGNLASKINTQNTGDATTYTWDIQNRLKRIQGPGYLASYFYDLLGRRVEKSINGDSTRYVYDGPQAVAEIKPNQSNATTSLMTGPGIDEVIARFSLAGGAPAMRTQLTEALAVC